MDALVLKHLEQQTKNQNDRLNATDAKLARVEAALATKNVTAPRYGEQHAKANTGNAILEAVGPVIAAISGDLAALKRQVKELQERPTLKYHGVWSAGKTYAENSLVTHAGSLWIAKKTTAAYPGGNAEPGSWQLCCKRGADGKDGRAAA
jgi:hypothetical protein